MQPGRPHWTSRGLLQVVYAMDDSLTPNPVIRPDCFGNPQKVCPRDRQGFMDPQPACMPCAVFKTCLQVALRKYGLVAPPPRTEQVTSGLLGFVKRWSDRKLDRDGGTDGSQ